MKTINVGNAYENKGGTTKDGMFLVIIGFTNTKKRAIQTYYPDQKFYQEYNWEWFCNNMRDISYQARWLPWQEYIGIALMNKDKFYYMLYNPDSKLPPKKRFDSLKNAKQAKRNWYRGNKCNIIQVVVDIDGNEEIPFNDLAENKAAENKLLYGTLNNPFKYEKTENEMKLVKLLKVDGKVIEITDLQAELLGESKVYEVFTAIKDGGSYMKTKTVEVTKLAKEDDEFVVVKVTK